jgi:hypothetical protein
MISNKKWWAVVKVGPDKFVKYRVNNFINFTLFLDRHFKDWRYINVYRYLGTNDKTGKQVAAYTKNNRPRTPQPE